MKKNLIGLYIIFFFVYLSSCVSNERKNGSNVSIELDKAVISASETIINKLPANAIVALFNLSTDETELTNFIIEEISSILINKGGLKIVERNKIENIEKEHEWQMKTGYVNDDELISIVDKFGAEYVISCYISGSGVLQRLRIKTWYIKTGETITANVYPVNSLGDQLVNSSKVQSVKPQNGVNEELKLQTIRDNGITVDYYSFDSDNYQEIQFEVYIDGTMHYFIISFCKIEVKQNEHDYNFIIQNVKSADEVYITSQSFNVISDNELSSGIHDSVFSELSPILSAFLSDQGIDRRNINFISRILIEKIYQNFN